MATNKKPKVDYKDVLKAKAQEIAPDTEAGDELSGEAYLANVNGEDVKFYRGTGKSRMSDSEWEALKKLPPASIQRVVIKGKGASDSGTSVAIARRHGEADTAWNKRLKEYESHPRFKESVYTSAADQRDAAREDSRNALKSLVSNKHYRGGDTSQGFIVTESELELLRGMDPEKAADFLETRVRDLEKEKSSNKKTPSQAKEAAPIVAPSTVEWDSEQKPSDRSTPIDEGDELKLQTSAGDTGMMGTNPASAFSKMAMGATPVSGRTPEEQAAYDQYMSEYRNSEMVMPRELQEAEAARKATVGAVGNLVTQPARNLATAVDERVFGNKPIIPEEVAQIPRQVGGATAALQGTGMELAGDALGMPNLAQKGRGIQEAGFETMMDPQTGQPVPVPPSAPVGPPAVPPQAPPPVDPAQSAAMSLAMNMPGGFSQVGVDPVAKKRQQESMQAAVEDAQNAQFTIAAQGEAQKEMIRQASEKEMAMQAEAQQHARLASEAKQTSVREAQRYQAAQMRVLEQAREAAATPTDPNRYWNNKDEGQKAAAIIAGALFGFTGQGMQWLQRIDGLVESDMRAQQADRASRVEGLRAEAQGLGLAGQQALQNGATMAEAHIIEKQARLEGLKSFLDMTSMKLNNSQQQMHGAQMSAMIGQSIAALEERGLGLAHQEAAMINENKYRNAQLRSQKIAAMAKAAGAGAGGGEQLRGPQVMEVADIMDAIKSAKNMSAEFKKGASGLLSKITSLDPTGTTDASRFNAKRDVVVQLIGRALEGGKLAEGDIGRYQAMIPKAGDLRGEERWDQLIKELEQRLQTQVGALQGAGFDVGSLPQQASGVLGGRRTRSTEREVE